MEGVYMIDKQQVKSHFSKNASTYNQYANIQKEMKNNLINHYTLLKGKQQANNVKALIPTI